MEDIMKALTLIGILVFGMFTTSLFAQQDVTKSDALEVTCMIVDSTGTGKDTFAVGEPATYVLVIRNISEFPITYRYSSEYSSLFTVIVNDYYKVDNNASSLSPFVLDSEGTLESGGVLNESKTAAMDKPGKYEFVVNPNFNFPKEYWPSTGPLYRLFDVIGDTEEGD
jgi:hypothetical protein